MPRLVEREGGGGGLRHVQTATLSTNTLLGAELDRMKGDGRKRKPTPTTRSFIYLVNVGKLDHFQPTGIDFKEDFLFNWIGRLPAYLLRGRNALSSTPFPASDAWNSLLCRYKVARGQFRGREGVVGWFDREGENARAARICFASCMSII